MKPLIARRPVFDPQEKIFAYDLAIRGAQDTSGADREADAEKLIAEIFLEIGVDRVADGHSVFVTVNRDMLLRGSLPMLPADRVILQVPASVSADEESAAACVALASAGYRIAAHIADPAPPHQLLQVAHVMRFDVASTGLAEVPAQVDRLRAYPGRLLATNVRHAGERDACLQLGFQLFEGYRFSSPERFTDRDIGIEHLNTFRVLKLVRDPNATDQEIEALLQGDVGLSYKLLRMVNSAATGARGVWSIGHALRLLGREQVGRWLAVLLVTDGGGNGVRAELVHLALVRARMCEALADVVGLRQARGPLFLVGMVSVLGLLLELPMNVLCDKMELANDLRAALLRREDFLGGALRLIETYVAGDWAAADEAAKAIGVESSAIMPLYLDALAWATANQRSEETVRIDAK